MKINAAIIGTGIGIKHLEAIEGYRGSKVSIICEKDKKKFLELKRRYPKIKITNDENDIFLNKKINLVSIASYDNYHFSQIVRCFESKKHIIVEKPMCLNKNELKKITFLAQKNKKIKIISNLVLRVNSLFNLIKKKIVKNNIYYIEADYIWGRPEKLLQWRSKINDYSITLGSGIHMIDLVIWILKSKPVYVQALGNNLVTRGTVFSKKSFAIYLFQFPNNVIVKVTSNAASTYDHFHELKIFEKNKSLIHSYSETFSFRKKNNKTFFSRIKNEYPDKKNRKKLIQSFVDILLDKKNNEIISLKEQIDLMTVCFAADKALETGKKIKSRYK